MKKGYVIALVLASVGAMGVRAAGDDAADRVVRVDLMRHKPAEGIEIVPLDDTTCEWSLPDGLGKTIRIPLAIDPAKYDEIRYDLMPLGSQVSLHTVLTRHPAEDAVASWYAKFPQRVGEWSAVRYETAVDDDGVWLRDYAKKLTAPGHELHLSLGARRIGFPGEAEWRKARIRNLRFVRRRLHVSFDLVGAEIVDNSSEIAYLYTLHVENRTDSPLTALLNADSRRTLRHFQVEAPAKVQLGKRETKGVPVRVFMPRPLAMTLPPLYSESCLPEVSLEDAPDSDAIPLMGYRPWPMWAAVPAFTRAPMAPTELQAALEAWKPLHGGVDAWRVGVVGSADAALGKSWPLPPERLLPSGFDQSYRCNDCGVWLRPVEQGDFDRHTCPSCKKIIQGDEGISKAGAAAYINRFSAAVRALALAYQVTGTGSYADKAAGMLLDLARFHPRMPVTGARSTSGAARLRFNTLHASYNLPTLAEGYAFLHSYAGLDEAGRGAISEMLKQEAFRLARHGSEYNNQGAEHFRAYGTVGLATGYWPLAAKAVGEDYNWHDMAEFGFDEDGFNSEGGGYHRAIFHAMNAMALFASQYGVELLTPRLKRVYDASLTIGQAGPAYELAYRAYRDPAYLPALAGVRRGAFNEYTLHAGVPGLPDASRLPVHSEVLANSGYVFLRAGTAVDFREIRMNYIKQFERSEQDRLSTMFFRNQRQTDTHVHRIAYSVPGSWWMTHSAAQNTVVVDGGSQREVPSRLAAFNPSPDAPAAVVVTDARMPLYEGVRQVRGIALVGDAAIVFDRIDADAPRMIDRYQYGPGRAPALLFDAKPVAALPALPEPGQFKEIAGGPAGREARIDFGDALRMRLVADCDLSLYRAVTFGGYQGRPMSVTFARAGEVKTVTFLAAFVEGKDSEPPTLRIVASSPERMKLEVGSADAARVIDVDVAAGRVEVRSK